jgi:antitoxin component YwqK of YwqJK toxin-antitoxin module
MTEEEVKLKIQGLKNNQVVDNSERDAKIRLIRSRGKSLQMIGDMFSLSKQRIFLITKDLNIKRERKYYTCKLCGKLYQKEKSNTYSFCSKECIINSKLVWSIRYKKCKKCGTVKRKHKGNGLCVKCYYKENATRIIANQKRYLSNKKLTPQI